LKVALRDQEAHLAVSNPTLITGVDANKQRLCCAAYVCFWHKADMAITISDVRL
jgi:hypothetical protein